MAISASYDPEDDKLRIYFMGKDKPTPEQIARMRECRYQWAPKQGCNYAVWNLEAEDLALEWAGEIEDEDTTLIERAEARAERFEGYSEKRADESNAAYATVRAIGDRIPFGQPILIGHHSQRRHERDIEKIDNGMRKFVRLWETSTYWTDRAAAALSHAEYKQQPEVRHRRIKGIESDLRRYVKGRAETEAWFKAWSAKTLDREQALKLANYDHSAESSDFTDDKITFEEARDKVIKKHESYLVRNQRCIDHFENRLAYERAMLAESGGIITDHVEMQIGGSVQIRGTRYTITRINKSGGNVTSVTVNDPSSWRKASIYSIEKVETNSYEPPTEEAAQKAKQDGKGRAQFPICNYPVELPPPTGDRMKDNYADAFREITKQEWDDHYAPSKGMTVIGANDKHGAHRVRAFFSARKTLVFITDQKRVDPPPPQPAV